MECSRQLAADKGKLLFHPRLMNVSFATHFTAIYNLLDPHHRRPLLLIFLLSSLHLCFCLKCSACISSGGPRAVAHRTVPQPPPLSPRTIINQVVHDDVEKGGKEESSWCTKQKRIGIDDHYSHYDRRMVHSASLPPAGGSMMFQEPSFPLAGNGPLSSRIKSKSGRFSA